MGEKFNKAKYDLDYAKKNIKRVPLDMQLSKYQELKAAAEAAGEKVNEYIKKAIEQRMERERQGGVVSISGDEEISPKAWSCIVSVTEQKK